MIKKNTEKFVLIGLDGLMPELLERYADRIPFINKLLSRSFYSPALPSIFTDTATNWTTIATGSKMETHGITGFTTHLEGMELDESIDTFNTDLCRSEYIWEAAEKQNKKCILINYPTAFPVKMNNGVIVGGDGLFSRDWTVKSPDLFTTRDDFEDISDIFVDMGGSQTRIELNDSKEWKNIPEVLEIVTGGIAAIKKNIEFDWGPAGAEINEHKMETHDLKDQENRYFLTVRDKNKLKVIISSSQDYNDRIAVLEKGQWSGWVEEQFNSIKCMRQYKLLDIDNEGKKITIYGTMAGKLKGWGFPTGVEDELIKEVSFYVEGLELSNTFSLMSNWIDPDTYFEIMDIQLESIIKISSYLSKNKEWDCMFIQFHAPDGVNHNFLRDLEEKDKDVFEKADDIFFQTIKRLMSFTKSIIDIFSDDVYFGIVSDHGCLPQRYYINAHGIMEKEGLTEFVKNKNKWDIDIKNSKAVYDPYASGIRINLKGREKNGIVNPGKEYEEVRNQIINRFRKVVNPETGEPAFSLIGRREDFKALGAYTNRVPDVLAIADVNYVFCEGRTRDISKSIMDIYKNGSDVIEIEKSHAAGVTNGYNASHWQLPNAKTSESSNRGIFFLSGPNINKHGYSLY